MYMASLQYELRCDSPDGAGPAMSMDTAHSENTSLHRESSSESTSRQIPHDLLTALSQLSF